MESVWADSTRAIIDAFLTSDAIKHWWWFVAILELAAQTAAIVYRRKAVEKEE